MFDFYRAVWRKLVSGLKVPFHLVGVQRQDETSAHVALREALVNALVHADFTGRSSILVVRRPDMFGFRNPGCMRVPIELAVRGGESDGRNRTLQQMFLMIGAGERAGSGVPKIHRGWREQHWRPPSLYELHEPSEQTLLELRMEDLLPDGVVETLRERFGERFEGLSPDERVVLATAALETTVSHSRAMTLCEMHPVDMTKLLQSLVQSEFLEKVGQGRGTKYHLPGACGPRPSFHERAAHSTGSPYLQTFGAVDKPSDLTNEPSELRSDGSRVTVGAGLGKEVQGLNMPLVDDLEALSSTHAASLEALAQEATGGRVPREQMERVILALCSERYITLRVLAALLSRSEDYLRQDYLNPLVRRGEVRLAFPQAPNDPRQAYSSSSA